MRAIKTRFIRMGHITFDLFNTSLSIKQQQRKKKIPRSNADLKVMIRTTIELNFNYFLYRLVFSSEVHFQSGRTATNGAFCENS